MRKKIPQGRIIDGILLLDKPKGITSNQALQMVKNIYRARKAGHTGSLDPLATGMLPICFGEATKFSQFLLEADKQYEVTGRLGVETTTGDEEGEITAQNPVPLFTQPMLEVVFSKFLGQIQQIPSMYSAIKKNGQPLYKLARQGIEIPREPRDIHIHHIHYLSHDAESFSIAVSCSKGTYIRTLIEDIGKQLGCGAHVQALRRLSVGVYSAEKMKTLDALEKLSLEPLSEENRLIMDAHLLPVDSAIENLPEIVLSEAAIYYLSKGQPVIVPYAPTSGLVRMKRKSGGFLGVGEILEDGKVAPRRLVA